MRVIIGAAMPRGLGSRRIRRQLPLLTSTGLVLVPGPPCIAYVGARDRANIGDAATHEACARVLSQARLVDLPCGGRSRVLAAVDRLRQGHAIQGVLIGGGTLVGRAPYRRRATALLAVTPENRLFTFGTGVEDPEFGASPRTSEEELRRWADLLAACDRVTVRGPRSSAILASHGVATDVIGDPALVLGQPAQPVDDLILGVNICADQDVWGGRVAPVVDAAVGLSRTMTQRGWSVRLIPMSPQDVPVLREVAYAVGAGVAIASSLGGTAAASRAIAGCRVFVGEKLHSVVLASAGSVPAVMLEYRPKCRDFQESIGRERFTMRTDELDVPTLVDWVDELSDDRDAHAAAILRAVDPLRQRARAHAESIARALHLPGLT